MSRVYGSIAPIEESQIGVLCTAPNGEKVTIWTTLNNYERDMWRAMELGYTIESHFVKTDAR